MLQIVLTMKAGLQALQAQGVELVDVDVSLLMRTYEVEAPNTFSYQYEMPRELAWSVSSGAAATSALGRGGQRSLQHVCAWPAASVGVSCERCQAVDSASPSAGQTICMSCSQHVGLLPSDESRLWEQSVHILLHVSPAGPCWGAGPGTPHASGLF